MTAQRLTIVRGGYLPTRDPRGARSYRRIKGLLSYIAFGQQRVRSHENVAPRGIWYDQLGRVHSHAAVTTWAQRMVHPLRYDHAYQLLLSTRDGSLQPADFNRALSAGAPHSGVYEWRWMVHEDTAHQHAHAVLFRRAALRRSEYRVWQQAMQGELDRRQLLRAQELVATQAQDQVEVEEQVLTTARGAGLDWSL